MAELRYLYDKILQMTIQKMQQSETREDIDAQTETPEGFQIERMSNSESQAYLRDAKQTFEKSKLDLENIKRVFMRPDSNLSLVSQYTSDAKKTLDRFFSILSKPISIAARGEIKKMLNNLKKVAQQKSRAVQAIRKSKNTTLDDRLEQAREDLEYYENQIEDMRERGELDQLDEEEENRLDLLEDQRRKTIAIIRQIVNSKRQFKAEDLIEISIDFFEDYVDRIEGIISSAV